jgi:hypothetical protein
VTALRFDCPFCPKVITASHVKRHLATHGDVPAKEMDLVWVRWLGARGHVPAETVDRLVALIERRDA